MSEMFHTVEHAARRLQLHPKTVLRFIRDGRLPATRLGKSWRIRPADLDALAGVAAPADTPGAVRVTAVAELAEVSMERSERLATALQAMLTGSSGRPRPIHLETAYDPERSQLKVIVIADAPDAAAVLQTLHGFAQAFR